MQIRELLPVEMNQALDLTWKVFQRFEAPDYSEEGIRCFENTIRDQQFLQTIRCYGAFVNSTLAGIIATRNGGSHIALFFVDETRQRQGIGRALFETILADAPDKPITVNASPYAVPVYQRLGFTGTQPEQCTDGIRYTPMVFKWMKLE